MFKMLVFILALEPLMLTSWLALVYLSSGKISEGLPFAAVAFMCGAYFFRGIAESVDFFRKIR
jgi:hypothetical protein